MKRYLATTGISEFWDTDTELFLLGQWCLVQKEKSLLLQGGPHTVVPSPWRPAIKIKEAAYLCRDAYEEVLPELSDQFNLMHGVSYPENYWRVLIGPWLVHFIDALYERYKRLENAFSLFPDFYTYILPEFRCKIWSVDTRDFLSLRGITTGDYYNLKLFSLIMRYTYPDKAIEKDMAPARTGGRSRRNEKFAKKLFYGAKKIKDAFYHPDIILSDMYHVNWKQMLSLELKSYPDNIVFENFEAALETPDDNYSEGLRAQLKFREHPDAFRALLRRLLPGAIPLCYLENFKKYKANVKHEFVKAVGSAVGWYFNETFKFMAAESALSGAKLIDFQYGGGYGMFLSSPPELLSLEKYVFFTWGWHSGNSEITVPLSSPYLSRLKDTYKPAGNKMLFIGANAHKYLYRFSSDLTPDDVPQYFFDKKRFFLSLDGSARNALLYKPYQETGWHETDMIKDLIPGIKLMPEGRLTPWLRKAKLVIIDYLGTTNLEALTINVPTIWFWDFNINLIRPEVEKDFDMLMEAGILYDNPEEAAKKTNEVYDNPLAWWQDPKVQKAKDIFCQKFALTSKDWQKEWINAFNAIPTYD